MRVIRLDKNSASCDMKGMWYRNSEEDPNKTVFFDRPLKDEEFDLLDSVLWWGNVIRGELNDAAWKVFCDNRQANFENWERLFD